MLYHVSWDEIPKFKLRIPQYRIIGENSSIKRICFSECINGAFSAMPGALITLKSRSEFQNLFKIRPLLHVYMVDDSKIDESLIIRHDKLVEKHYVADADVTKETWLLTDNFTVQHNYIDILKYMDIQVPVHEIRANVSYIFLKCKILNKDILEDRKVITDYNKLSVKLKKDFKEIGLNCKSTISMILEYMYDNMNSENMEKES